jgi:hypothetical protein
MRAALKYDAEFTAEAQRTRRFRRGEERRKSLLMLSPRSLGVLCASAVEETHATRGIGNAIKT